MATIMEFLGQILETNGMIVQYGSSEMLVTVPLKGNRKQVVKVSVIAGGRGSYSIIRYQSRACVAQGPKMIRMALQANAESDHGAYALDTSVDPPALDIVYGYVTTPRCEPVPAEFLSALQRVAAVADAAEKHTTGTDYY